MTALHKLFIRVHARYTRSTHVADLTAFARWLIEHEYAARYAQRLAFRALRSLEDSDCPPGSKWTVDALERTFRGVRQRRLYRHARRAFAAFLQSVGRLAPPSDNGPHASVLAAYQGFLSEVRGLAPTTIAQHLPEVRALLRHALPEYFMFALAVPRMLSIECMLSRTERIDDFHLKVSRTEKELYEEFLKTEEAEIVLEMQQYFAQAKRHAGGIRFDNTSLWSKIENRVGVWFAEVCADRNQNENLIQRSKEAILHRMKNLLAKTIRESLGTK